MPVETKLAPFLIVLTLGAACGTSSPDPAPNPTVGGSAGASGSSPTAGGSGGGGSAAIGGAGAGAGGLGGGGASGGSGGGGGSSAGSSGASGAGGSGGASGGTGGSAGSSCASGQYLLCEDFEQTAVGQIPTGWTRRGPMDKVGVADDQAKSGTRSLKLGAMEKGERRIARPGAVLGAAHWGRVRFKVQLPVTDAFVHSTLIAGFGVGPTKGDVEVRLVDTVKAAKSDTPSWCSDKQVSTNCYQLLYNVQPSNSAEFGKGGPYGWSFDESWHCAEWHVDSTKQSYELYYDGVKVNDVSFENGAGKFENSEIPTAFGELRVGWNNYQSATAPGFTAWLDDLAIAEQRIRCD